MKKIFFTCLVLVAMAACKKEGSGRSGDLWSGVYLYYGQTSRPYVMEFTGDNTLKFHHRDGTISAAYEYDEEKQEMTMALPGELPHFIAKVTNDTFTNIINIGVNTTLVSGFINTTTEQKLNGLEYYGIFTESGTPLEIKLRFTSENSCVTKVNNEAYMPTTSFVRNKGTLSFQYDLYGYKQNFFGVIQGDVINALNIQASYTLKRI